MAVTMESLPEPPHSWRQLQPPSDNCREDKVPDTDSMAALTLLRCAPLGSTAWKYDRSLPNPINWKASSRLFCESTPTPAVKAEVDLSSDASRMASNPVSGCAACETYSPPCRWMTSCPLGNWVIPDTPSNTQRSETHSLSNLCRPKLPLSRKPLPKGSRNCGRPWARGSGTSRIWRVVGSTRTTTPVGTQALLASNTVCWPVKSTRP